MNTSKGASSKHPYDKANLFSKWTFFWAWKCLFDFRKPKSNFARSCVESEASANFYSTLKRKTKDDTKSGLISRRLFASYGTHFLVLCLPLAIAECLVKPAQAIFLRMFLESVKKDSSTDSYIFAMAILLLAFTATLINQPISFGFQKIASKCRVSCSRLIYGKILGMRSKCLQDTDVGKITNMLGNDVGRFDQSLKFIPHIFIVPIQSLVFSYLLWESMGIVVFAGLGIVYIIVPLQYFNGKLSSSLRAEISTSVDKRCKIMSEIVEAIRVIKMYAWEKYFISSVNFKRRVETSLLRKRFYLRGVYSTMYSSLSKLIPFVTIIWYLEKDNDFNVPKVFFMVACFNTMIQSMTYTFPLAVSSAGELLVSVKRIEGFLACEDQRDKTNYFGKASGKIEMKQVSSSWNGVFSHISRADLILGNGMLVYVIGCNGSGKTSLLNTILDEVDITSGTVSVEGRVAYSSQKPWIFPGTIRDNILIGKPYYKQRYDAVIEAACLRLDLISMVNGDMTTVAENGSGLSGGQCSRISLARCIYQEAEIYLLDDPFSALDSNVSAQLFQACAKTFLSEKLRIVVSNQTNMARHADYVVIMNQGSVIAQGSPDYLSGMFPQYFRGESKQEVIVERKSSIFDIPSLGAPVKATPELDESDSDSKYAPASFLLILNYLGSAKSNFLLFWVILSILVTHSGASGAEYWISFLSYEADKSSNFDQKEKLLGIYGGLVGVVIVGNITQSILFFSYCTKAAVNIHIRMINGLMSISTRFFDSNCAGVILNRFTKDLVSVDEQLPSNIFDMFVIFLQMGVSLAMIIIADYYMAIATTFLILILFCVRRFYIKTAKILREIEISAKSPVLSHVGQTVKGLLTIRSSSAQEFFMSRYDKFQDDYSSAWFISIAAARGFGMGVEFLCNIFVTVLVASIVLAKSGSGGSIGLAMTSALSLSSWLQQALRLSSDVENLLVPVGKLLEFAKLEPECAIEGPQDGFISNRWPSEGGVSFVNVFMCYDDTKVLRNVTFDVKPREKIGIVGRTGAGKSSIIQALFRMTKVSGDILIDGVNINNIAISELRQSIAIIPQNSVVFSGTVRQNLDPFNLYSDSVLWKALSHVKLANKFPSLDVAVEEEHVLSSGQKQLICVARAIVQNKKIIVMDEATSDIDYETDQLIQGTIKDLFADSTLIIIAHRLSTVIDCDRILVLDYGAVKEYDPPHELLKIQNGYFTSLVTALECSIT